MPNVKSAAKRMRQNKKRRLRNKMHKSATKTQIKKFLKALKNKELQQAEQNFCKAASLLDKLAKRRIIHPNTASRKKSRLARRLNLLRTELNNAAAQTTS